MRARSKWAVILAVLLAIGFGAEQAVSRKNFNPKNPGDEWVEVRRAKKATPSEIAAENDEENARIQIQKAKSIAGKLERQRQADRAVGKQQRNQIYGLQKSVKAAQKETSRVKGQLVKSEKRLKDSQKDVANLQAALKSKAWKWRNVIGIAIALMLLSAAIAFVAGFVLSQPRRIAPLSSIAPPPAPIAPVSAPIAPHDPPAPAPVAVADPAPVAAPDSGPYPPGSILPFHVRERPKIKTFKEWLHEQTK